MKTAECSQVRLTTPNAKSTAFTFDEYACLKMGIDAARSFASQRLLGLAPDFETALVKIEAAQESLRRGECDPPAPAELAPAEEATLAQIEQEMRQQKMGASLALFLICGLEDEESAQALLAMLRAQPPASGPSPYCSNCGQFAGCHHNLFHRPEFKNAVCGSCYEAVPA